MGKSNSKDIIFSSFYQKFLRKKVLGYFFNVSQSGDEAMLYAKSLPNATVIVSENRGKLKGTKLKGTKLKGTKLKGTKLKKIKGDRLL